MSTLGDVRHVRGAKPTAEDEAWLAYGAKLRENAVNAYNEAAKILVTGTSLFIAFYGNSLAKTTSIGWRTIMLIVPIPLLLLGVALCIAVMFPHDERVSPQDITGIQDYVMASLVRKQRCLFLASVTLVVAVIVAFSLLVFAP